MLQERVRKYEKNNTHNNGKIDNITSYYFHILTWT